MGRMIDIDLPRLDKTYDVNLRGAFVWVQEAWRQAMEEHGGNVINISSIGGLSVETSIGHYNVTKAALIHLTRSLAKELAPSVRVNAICPGLVKTDMARALWEANEDAVATMVPLHRLGEPAGHRQRSALPGVGPVVVGHRHDPRGRRRHAALSGGRSDVSSTGRWRR